MLPHGCVAWKGTHVEFTTTEDFWSGDLARATVICGCAAPMHVDRPMTFSVVGLPFRTITTLARDPFQIIAAIYEFFHRHDLRLVPFVDLPGPLRTPSGGIGFPRNIVKPLLSVGSQRRYALLIDDKWWTLEELRGFNDGALIDNVARLLRRFAYPGRGSHAITRGCLSKLVLCDRH